MTALVPIEPGQWVLSYVDHYGPDPIEQDLVRAIERLVCGGSGWDCIRRASEQFDVVQVGHLMPNSFRTPGGRRQWRYLVVAAADDAEQLAALRDKLFNIGFETDRAIDEETARLIGPFAQRARAEALTKIQGLVPHIFSSNHSRS